MTALPARTVARGLAVALLLLPLAACGGDDDDDSTAAPAPAAATSSAPAATSAAPTASSAAPAAGGKTLKASVGATAFTIDLKDSTGAKVSTLPAGTYTIEVDDPSTIHNFHLTGAGVDQKTSVPETATTTWSVTLTAGSYTYKCDPHPPMTGSFTVT